MIVTSEKHEAEDPQSGIQSWIRAAKLWALCHTGLEHLKSPIALASAERSKHQEAVPLLNEILSLASIHPVTLPRRKKPEHRGPDMMASSFAADKNLELQCSTCL